MGPCSIVYVGIYALIYQLTILGERIVSRVGLPRRVLPSGILKIEKYCPGLKVRSPLLIMWWEEVLEKKNGYYKVLGAKVLQNFTNDGKLLACKSHWEFLNFKNTNKKQYPIFFSRTKFFYDAVWQNCLAKFC